MAHSQPFPPTKLASFMTAHGLRVPLMADFASVSRRHLYNVQTGDADPTRHVMVEVARACSILLRRKVRVAELFDLDDEADVRAESAR
jgi:hypothetical protein